MDNIDEFNSKIVEIFNVDKLLILLVVESCIYNPDNFFRNFNNYYFYLDVIIHKWEIISIDYDSGLLETSNENIYKFDNFKLVRNIMRIPEFRKRYSNLYRWFLNDVFNSKSPLFQRLDNISSTLYPHVKTDYFDFFLFGESFDTISNIR